MKRFIGFVWIFLSILVQASANNEKSEQDRVQALRKDMGGLGYGTSREEIIANRGRRQRQLTNLVNHMRQQLADHSAGEKILDAKEKEMIEKRRDVYQQKLESMKEDLDDRVSYHRAFRRSVLAAVFSFFEFLMVICCSGLYCTCFR